jgi:phosphatidylglycerophosphate synthase
MTNSALETTAGPDAKPGPKRRWVRIALAALGVLMLSGFLWAAGPKQVADNIGQVGFGFGYLLLVTFTWRIIETTGTWVLMTPERRVGWGKLFLIRSAGESVNMLSLFGNVAGEPVKAMLLKRHLGGTESTGLVLLDKTIFFLGSMTFMTVGTVFGVWVLADRPAVVVTSLALLTPWVSVLSFAVWRQAKGDFVVQASRLVRLLRIKLSENTMAKIARVDALLSDFWRLHKARFFMSYTLHTLGRCVRAVDVWLSCSSSASTSPCRPRSSRLRPACWRAPASCSSRVAWARSKAVTPWSSSAIGLGMSVGVTVGILRRIRNYVMAGFGYCCWSSGRPKRRHRSEPPPRVPGLKALLHRLRMAELGTFGTNENAGPDRRICGDSHLGSHRRRAAPPTVRHEGHPRDPDRCDETAALDGESDSVIVIRGDHVFEATLVVNLMANPGTVLCLEDGRPMAFHVAVANQAAAVSAIVAGSLPPALAASLRVVHPKDLSFNNQLRKRATPYVLLISDEQRVQIEEQVFAGSYKGVTDFVTKHVIPRAVLWLTRVAAAVGMRPNHVTTVGLILTILATWLFHEGHFGAGLVCAWSMSVLDSVDGKLARVTLDWSKFGDFYDHSIDLIHPPFWYWAWMVGCGAAFASHPYATLAIWAIMAGYVAQRVLEIAFMLMFRIEIHIWRPVDSWFRLITARRNPNLAILTVATAGRQAARGHSPRGLLDGGLARRPRVPDPPGCGPQGAWPRDRVVALERRARALSPAS